MKKVSHVLMMVGIAFILGTAGINLIWPVSLDVLPLAKGGFYTGCFAVFMATLPEWF